MKIPIFLSYSTPYTSKQQKFIDDVKEYLLFRGMEPRTLGVTDYDMDEPLVASRRLMIESNGLITLAFRRYFVAKGAEKPGHEKEVKIANQYFSSVWCQIETAMAFQLGLPILIFREQGVIADGVLEKGVVGTYLSEFDLSNPGEYYLDSAEWRQVIGEWEGYVRAVRKAKGKPPKLY